MQITGKVVQVMDVVTGNSAKGSWAKQDFVMETGDKYPKKVSITLWGQEAIDKYDLVEGMEVTASIEVESREYQGKWYTNVKAWKIEGSGQRPVEREAKEQTWTTPTVKENTDWPSAGPISPDDLPF